MPPSSRGSLTAASCRGPLPIFFPDAVVRATSFSGVAPVRLRACHQLGPGKDGARPRPVEDIFCHFAAFDNTAFCALLSNWLGGCGIAT